MRRASEAKQARLREHAEGEIGGQRRSRYGVVWTHAFGSGAVPRRTLTWLCAAALLLGVSAGRGTAAVVGPPRAVAVVSGYVTAMVVAEDTRRNRRLVVAAHRTFDLFHPAGIRAWAVREGGAVVGEVAVSAPELSVELQPAVAYNAALDEFLVVWARKAPSDSRIFAQRVDAGSLALEGGRATVDDAGSAYGPAVQANGLPGAGNRWFVVWTDLRAGVSRTLGAFLDSTAGTGSPAGAFTVGASRTVSARCSAGIAFVPSTGSYLLALASDLNVQTVVVDGETGGVSLGEAVLAGCSACCVDVSFNSWTNTALVVGTGGPAPVVGRRTTASGAAIGAEITLPTNAPNPYAVAFSTFVVGVCAEFGGGWMVTALDRSTITAHFSYSSTFASRVDPSGLTSAAVLLAGPVEAASTQSVLVSAIAGSGTPYGHSDLFYTSWQTPIYARTVRSRLFVGSSESGNFDGVGGADRAVVRPNADGTLTWSVATSSGGQIDRVWAEGGHGPVAGDYDGDGPADVAVWRPVDGEWRVLGSAGGTTLRVFGSGTEGDIPVPADYDGDGKTDVAVFRPAAGRFLIVESSREAAGLPADVVVAVGTWGDIPVPADYDGNGEADAAVFRPSTGEWHLVRSRDGPTRVTWGAPGDQPVPGDFDGDGQVDVAVYRPGTAATNDAGPTPSVFLIRPSSTGQALTVSWGEADDVAVPADYDGDGRADVAVWRPGSPSRYVIRRSRDGERTEIPFGEAFDVPIGSTATDQDGDRLPDGWEGRVGLDLHSAAGADGATGDPDGDGRTNAEEYAAGTHPRGVLTRYFAEGAQSAFFDTSFALLNPSETAAAHVLLRFLPTGAAPVESWLTLAPLSRATLPASAVPGLGTAEFSTTLESDVAVVADRTMTWDARGYGAHAETAVEAPQTTWYLAEGATHSGFELFYLIQNPHDEAATVDVRYLRPSPAVPLVKPYAVAPHSRLTIWVNREDAGLAATDVSAVVTAGSGAGVIVERAMYRDGGGRMFDAGHGGAGGVAPATSWFLAEGATGEFFDLFVLMANPGDAPATVQARYLLPDGRVLGKDYGIPPASRVTVWVDEETQQGGPGWDWPAKPLANTAVSVEVQSVNGVPVIVERAMWWPGPTSATWHEAHNAAGSTVTGSRWALAEGEVGGASARETYVLVANTSAAGGPVQVTVVYESGRPAESRTYTVGATSRTTLDMRTEFPATVGERFGVIVESPGTPALDLIVERAMYWDAEGVHWAAGTSALGTRLSP